MLWSTEWILLFSCIRNSGLSVHWCIPLIGTISSLGILRSLTALLFHLVHGSIPLISIVVVLLNSAESDRLSPFGIRMLSLHRLSVSDLSAQFYQYMGVFLVFWFFRDPVSVRFRPTHGNAFFCAFAHCHFIGVSLSLFGYLTEEILSSLAHTLYCSQVNGRTS